MQDRLKDLFSDLGRRNFRGVRACPKCGTYNGIRGFSCKNKSCDVVFKAINERRKKNTVDICRIHTGNANSQIYSVRLRDKGPDYRAFVQVNTELLDNGEGHITANHSAQCYVEACSKVYVSGQDFTPTCVHVKAVTNCQSDSEILSVKASFVSTLNIKAEAKEELLALLSSCMENGVEIPIVQRVSKTIFVVRTDKLEKFPLGFLHCAFVDMKSKTEGVERKFYCPCRKLKASVENARDCVHYYACLVAFLSEESLTTEFAQQIHLSGILAVALEEMEATDRPMEVQYGELSTVADESEMLCGDVSFSLPEDGSVITETSNLALDSDFLNPSMEVNLSSAEAEEKEPSGDQGKDTREDVSLTLPVELNVTSLNSLLVTCGDQLLRISAAGKVQIPALKRNKLKTFPAKIPPRKITNHGEEEAVLTFEPWLASVTERINHCIDPRMTENPPPLIYHIPQTFFECLRERICSGSRKKRLPNETAVIDRKDQPPFHVVTRYTWRLQNPLFVKHIFDTSTVPLQLTQAHVGSPTTACGSSTSREGSTGKAGRTLPLLRPLESRVFLKIGPASPFIVEWIPDMFPISKTGELTLRFQLGQQRHPLNKETVSSFEEACPEQLHKRTSISVPDGSEKHANFQLGLISAL